jgi:hypothetical protein
MDLAKQLVNPLHLTLIWTQGIWRKMNNSQVLLSFFYCLCFEISFSAMTLRIPTKPPFIKSFRSGASFGSKTCVKTTEFLTYIEGLCITTSRPLWQVGNALESTLETPPTLAQRA